MTGLAQLSENERQRILRLMGFEVWQRRFGDYRPPRSTAMPPRVERGAATGAAVARARVEPRVFPEIAAPSPAPQPRARALSRQAQAVLLVLEKRVHADLQLIRHLVLALPGSTICTADTVSGGSARFALQLGVDATLPADVLGLRVPALAELQSSASARRALWWSLKPMLRALQV